MENTAPHPAPRHTTSRHTAALAIAPAHVPRETCGGATWRYGGESGDPNDRGGRGHGSGVGVKPCEAARSPAPVAAAVDQTVQIGDAEQGDER